MANPAAATTDDNPLVYLKHHDNYSDDKLRGILRRVRTFAMVGASTHWRRPSFYAMKYLQHKGFRIIPVNPARGGDEILGERVYASIAEIPDQVQMVDIFRTSEEAYAITEEVIANKDAKGIEVLWMQLTVRNDPAAELAEAAGLEVVMNRCPKIEFGRLSGELSWAGVNSRIITAKSLRSPKA
ncbi:MAG: CoA-binding protein [Alphaproteobacteria bacterium]|jgi:predicted CoA-binding protein|nr:CoA-binding protein [Alphaproteobacteria bacterium]MDP6517302.1 CoA-binding protein [Alphaproteobacteria bacterium]